MNKKYYYWKCPVCAKVSRPERLEEGAAGEHPFQVAIQRCIGRPRKYLTEKGKKKGSGGFHWTRRSMSQEELARVKVILKTVSGRLDDLIDVEEELNSASSKEDFWKKADAYLAEAEQVLESVQGEIEYRKRLINKLAKQF